MGTPAKSLSHVAFHKVILLFAHEISDGEGEDIVRIPLKSQGLEELLGSAFVS